MDNKNGEKFEKDKKSQGKWRTSWQIPLFILSLITLGLAYSHKTSVHKSGQGHEYNLFEKIQALIKSSDYNAAQAACREIIEKTSSDLNLQSQAKIYFAECSLLKEGSEKSLIDWDEALKTLKSINLENLREEEKSKYKFQFFKEVFFFLLGKFIFRSFFV